MKYLFQTLAMWLYWLADRYRMTTLKPDPRTRQQKRAEKVSVNGRTMLAMDYCDAVAAALAPIQRRNGQTIPHKMIVRQMYYRWGLRGVKYYVNRQRKNTKLELVSPAV